MRQDRLRSIKILDELMSFCYKAGATNMHIDMEDNEDYLKIHISGNTSKMPMEKIETLKQLLDTPRQDAIEGYYWGLAGESDSYEELNLVGMLIDKAEIEYNQSNLDITIYRSKHEIPD